MNETSPTPLEAFLPLPENQFALAAVCPPGGREGAGKRSAARGAGGNAAGNTSETATDAATRLVFLHGPSGSGKTLLAQHAIARYLALCPTGRVLHQTAPEFAADFAESSVQRTIPLFQAATRNVDFLVLEDLHLIEGRHETQKQLLALIDLLERADGRILWTSRKSPGELAGFLPRLVSRFRSAAQVQITLPGPESRTMLISHFARLGRLSIHKQAVRLLADRMEVSPRELKGTLVRLRAMARSGKKPIDELLATEFLESELLPMRPTLAAIAQAVARQFGVPLRMLRSRVKRRSQVVPRQCAMFLARELTEFSLAQIGRHYGNRDHSTVVHACQRIEKLAARDQDLALFLDQIRRDLGRTRDDGC
jgi:chromosomal replication initiator protein